MKIVVIAIAILLLALFFFLDLPAYYFDADMHRWRCKPNRSWRVFWKIWRSLHDQPCAVSWKRRFLVARSLWRVQL